MQTSPEPGTGGRLHTARASFRGWLIKMGLIPPPDELNDKERQLSGEQEQAQVDLRFHQLPRPPRSPGI